LDCEAFLFCLVYPDGASPIQLKVKNDASKAIYCHNDLGPTFGYREDLVVCGYPNTRDCSVNLGNTFGYPENLSSVFLTGSSNFKVSEMEVFGLEP
jgi:hypothetical protein